MKNFIALATFFHLGSANASLVAIMDTGVDISHKDIAPKTWTNKNEKEGSLVDLDGSGLPGDVHGWDFTENTAKVFNNKYNFLINQDVLKFYNLYAKFEMKTANQEELLWLQKTVEDKDIMNKVNFVGGYSHGTHVGGISALNNPKAQIMSLKILPTVYEEPVQVSPKSIAENKNEPVQLELDFSEAKMTIDELKAEIVKSAVDQIDQMTPLHGYLNFHKVDVVNQSFGIGFTAAVGFIQAAFVENIKRKPTNEELAELLILYFKTLRVKGPEMFQVAPNTLFVIAAGNDTSDNDALPDYPADIEAPNKIVVAATVGYSELADFSNFGARKVDVAAPGVAILSTSPNQNYLPLSGTSQAAPFVTNVIAQAKDINPSLDAHDLKNIVFKTVDVKTWLKGKVSTSGIVNKARALKAAELSKTMNVEIAIAKSLTLVLDVAVPKSFGKKFPSMSLNFRPIRPSLLMKLPILH